MNHETTKSKLLKEIKEICNDLDIKMKKTLVPDYSNYDYIIDELQIQEDTIQRVKNNTKKDTNHKLDFCIVCLDLYLNIKSNLYFTFEESIAEHNEILNWNFQDENLKHRNPTVLVTLIIATQLNYLVSIKNLILSGFDFQANILIRSFIELNDLQIAMISDKEFSKKYCFIYEDEGKIDYKYVQKLYDSYICPSKLRGFFEQAMKDISIDNHALEIFKRLRKSYYFDELSTFTHPEPLSILLGIMPFDEKTNYMRYNVYGGYSSSSKYILNKLLFHGFTNLLLELELLKIKHSIIKKIQNNRWDIIYYKFTVLNRIVCKYILPNMAQEE